MTAPLQNSCILKQQLTTLANQPYRNIRNLKGNFQFARYTFQFIRIQGSPGANPASIACISVSRQDCNFPIDYFQTSPGQIALADFLIRRFQLAIQRYARQNRGKDGSGSFHTVLLGQKILQRDCILIKENTISLRFILSLPATEYRPGNLDADQTWQMLNHELSDMVDYTFNYKQYAADDKRVLQQFIITQKQRQEITAFMAEHHYCVFINNGAILPRISGIDDQPDISDTVLPFQSPAECQIDIPLSSGQTIKGMAIKEGVNCITGGGYHGKSTLLQAILNGIYPHIPGDGRELVVTREDAVFVRAEEGRSIRQVNIQGFISQLPHGQTTHDFSTSNASGSTSQAASIVEAIETGSRLLLFDEDTCATNFLFRDALIEQVLENSSEPIKVLYSNIRTLWHQHNISLFFVVGGLGSFLQKADTCLLMENYQCKDITGKVRQQLGEIIDDNACSLNFPSARILSNGNFNPQYINQRLNKTVAKRIKDLRNAPRQLEYGMDLINLDSVPQIAEAPQLLSIGYCLYAIRQEMEQQDHNWTISEWLSWLFQQIDLYGLDYLNADYPGLLSRPRKFEVAAAINRTRSLNIKPN